jgi:hypothetical protein
MALTKLNRINKGGEIIINTDHILYIEIESRVTTIHMTNNLLFSVTESPDVILQQAGAPPTACANPA